MCAWGGVGGGAVFPSISRLSCGVSCDLGALQLGVRMRRDFLAGCRIPLAAQGFM